MSGETLHCPSCDAPAPPLPIQTNRPPAIQRYTCPACGRTTLRDELVHRVNLRMAGGGPPAGAAPHVPVFGLIETLRGVGDLGDQNDLTLIQRAATSAAALQVPANPIIALAAMSVVPVSISYLRFFARVGFFFSGVGPLDPQAWIRWRLGLAGTLANGDGVTIGGGVGVYTDIGGLVLGVTDIATDPDGNPWTVANVDTLRMAGVFGVVDDQGSGETTTCEVTELWAEVWGYI